MEAKQPENEARPKKETSRTMLLVIAAFLAINAIVIGLIFIPDWSGRKGRARAEETTAAAPRPVDEIALVKLGKIEVTKAIDPTQMNFMRVSVEIALEVDVLRYAELNEKVRKLEPLFKEQARKAFSDADARDMASENLAGVKNAIKTHVNEMLGEEAVKGVIFAEYRPY